MQNIETFNANLGTAILLCGGAGTGKTVLGMRLFPKTYVFVADLNFKSGLDYLKANNALSNIVGFDTASPDENGKIIPINMRYDRMFTKINEASASSDVDAIFLDSAMFIEPIFKAKICGASNEQAVRLEGFKQWGDLQLVWRAFIMGLRQSGKKLILSAHEKKERDESDMIFKYQIAVEGGIRDQLPALFSDVWRCEIQENNNVHTWNVRMLSNVRQEHLKRSSMFAGLPPVIKADELVAKVKTI